MAQHSGNPKEPFEAILVATLARVLDFLKFAEAKNAGLLTLASAWSLAGLSLIAHDDNLPNYLKNALYIALPLSISAAILAILSFLPRTNLPAFLGGKRAGPHNKNLLYFGDVSQLTVKEFDQDVRRRYSPPSGAIFSEEYISDITTQISVNSQIVMRKLRLFKIGMILILLAAVLLLIPACIEAARKVTI